MFTAVKSQRAHEAEALALGAQRAVAEDERATDDTPRGVVIHRERRRRERKHAVPASAPRCGCRIDPSRSSEDPTDCKKVSWVKKQSRKSRGSRARKRATRVPSPEYRGAFEPRSTTNGDAFGSIASRARPGLARVHRSLQYAPKTDKFRAFF